MSKRKELWYHQEDFFKAWERDRFYARQRERFDRSVRCIANFTAVIVVAALFGVVLYKLSSSFSQPNLNELRNLLQ